LKGYKRKALLGDLVRPSVWTYYQQLNSLPDFHEVRNRSFLKSCEASVSFVKIGSVTVAPFLTV